VHSKFLRLNSMSFAPRILVCSLLVASCAGSHATSRPPAQPIGVPAGEVTYAPAPPNLPKGVEMAVLEGDPKRAAIFTLRLRVPAGFSLPPHTHPVDERVTVLAGAVQVGFGDQVTAEAVRTYPAGSFYVNPPGLPHFVLSPGGAEIQITAMGPWRADFLVAAAP
jgi:quercetin dioxygenase-like cupin family protein